MATIIAFSGKAGSGKDTAANIVKELIPNTVHLSFAAPLKEMAQQYFPFCDVITKDPISRATLQGLGTLMREQVDPDYWVDKLLNNIPGEDPNGMYVITDLRYLNELHNIYTLKREHNVYVIRMEGRRYEQDASLMAHPSETALDFEYFDYTYQNTGTIEDIKRYLQETIHELRTYHE